MLDHILQQVQQGQLSIEEAKQRLAAFDDLGFAKVDYHRKKRQGFPEIVFGEGKTAEQIIAIVRSLQTSTEQLLCTRMSADKAQQVQQAIPELEYNETARLLYKKADLSEQEQLKGYVAVLAAGTSDLAVAEEAAITAEVLGSNVRRFYDVGVAGIHRLLHHAEEIQQAVVSVVVAGMEGALPSVVGGLVAHPVIAVPTSIGYGANFQGLSALLTMLNSCASGISVVNIDNGFGGGYNAALIHRLANKGVSEA
ncbi:1-(5-phosphoribosyl)-5-amino-4-imidazole-carboxyl ate carboxylase [Paenibacillus montaniterrae]|uniref:1-(5-phosphoribosyl)-5-amino-4-imidazole-carboxyl ate carboxylase n=1 Tax=Paenibacillus montaniterrae TaxID=429341 RepID=A0A919YMI5_9BACL|nr:nickel pincer cofactor biosynthesis protein LarB [Paenibacillus montaniterrae]GIP16215.1 1-(5-phosphoribosyl)-5-amino-4-imidazole-carboxyl ate carboxylase [Paenibacillus montaniterrae]